MARLLGPGVALMNRLRFPQKFIVISLLFALPLGFMMYLWLNEIQQQLAVARKERAGLEYVLALRHVLEPLDLVPALALLAEGGDAGASGELAQARRQISAGADAVDLADARLGDALGASDLWKMLRPRVTYPAVEPGALIAETLRLVAQVGDNSNLTLDPDLDTYYLMDAVVTRLPALADHARVMGTGLLAVEARAPLSPARVAEVLAARIRAEAEGEALDRGHAVVFRENPSIRPAIEPPFMAADAAVARLTGLVNDAGLGGVSPSGRAPSKRESSTSTLGPSARSSPSRTRPPPPSTGCCERASASSRSTAPCSLPRWRPRSPSSRTSGRPFTWPSGGRSPPSTT